MRKSNKSSINFLCTIITGIVLTTCSVVFSQNPSRYQLRITNDSEYDIYKVHMSSSEVTQWGQDYLGDRIMHSGDTLTLSDIAPGEYDVKFLDEDGDACVLSKVKMFENQSWSITTDWLLRCEWRQK